MDVMYLKSLDRLKVILKKVFFDNYHLAAALSKSNISVYRLYLKIITFLLLKKAGFLHIAWQFTFYFQAKKFTLYIQNSLDFSVLHEVFVIKEYDWFLNRKVSTVLDLGAHWGDTTLYYALHENIKQIVAVEPMLDLYSRLIDSTTSYKQVVPIHGAIAPHDGEISFYVSEDTVGNSLNKRSTKQVAVSVPSYTLETLMNISPIKKFDLVKFDIEGGEEYLFKNHLFPTIADAYIGEIHLNLISFNLDQIQALFDDNFHVEFHPLKMNRYIMRAYNKKMFN